MPQNPAPFEQYAAADIRRLIEHAPLAWVIAADGWTASQLPLIGVYDTDGDLTGLLGHFARANPLHAALQENPLATVLFNGPQGYISPTHAANRQWGPTWNYAHLRLRVEIAVDTSLTLAALDKLAAQIEDGMAHPWRPDELGDRLDGMAARIIGFSARVIETKARFKLGQDETPETIAHIMASHPDAELTRWMRDFNRDRETEADD